MSQLTENYSPERRVALLSSALKDLETSEFMRMAEYSTPNGSVGVEYDPDSGWTLTVRPGDQLYRYDQNGEALADETAEYSTGDRYLQFLRPENFLSALGGVSPHRGLQC